MGGKDHGGHRAGRRNFVENVCYDDEEGVKHTRILFNIEGSRGKGYVWADVAEGMSAGQIYYLIVQDKRSQQLVQLIDERPDTPLAVRQAEIATLLSKKGVMLYGSPNCNYTKQQLSLFGINGTQALQFTNCVDDRKMCEDAGIQHVPTWIFTDPATGVKTKKTGVQDPEDLLVMANRIKQ